MSSSGVTISDPGTATLAATLADASAALDDFGPPSREAASLVVGSVEAPYRTGALAGTVAAEASAVGFTLTAGGPAAPYGPVVHARDPFLTRALEARTADVLDTYTEHAEAVLSDIHT